MAFSARQQGKLRLQAIPVIRALFLINGQFVVQQGVVKLRMLEQLGSEPLNLVLQFLDAGQQAGARLVSKAICKKIDLVFALRFIGSGALESQRQIQTQLGPLTEQCEGMDLEPPSFSQAKKFIQSDLPLALNPILEIIGSLCFPEDLTVLGRMKITKAKKVLRQFRFKVEGMFRCRLGLGYSASLLNFYSVWTSQRVGIVKDIIRTWDGLWKQSRMKQIGQLPLQVFRWVNLSLRNYSRLQAMSSQLQRQAGLCLQLRQLALSEGLARVGYEREGRLLQCERVLLGQ